MVDLSIRCFVVFVASFNFCGAQNKMNICRTTNRQLVSTESPENKYYALPKTKKKQIKKMELMNVQTTNMHKQRLERLCKVRIPVFHMANGEPFMCVWFLFAKSSSLNSNLFLCENRNNEDWCP